MFTKTQLMIKNAISQNYFPCVAIAIGCKSNSLLRFYEGHISSEKSSPLCCEQTLFDIASITKVFTTLSALCMIEEGAISLDDSVQDFFSVPDSFNSIKLRHLLTHTSGISGHFLLEDYPCLDTVQAICSYPLAYEIGTQTQYSCMGFILLGKILEKANNMPLDHIITKYVTTPLSLHRTGFLPTGICAPTEKIANEVGYFNNLVHDENARYLKGISGNAGIFSNLTDMEIVAQMLASGGMHKGKRYLCERTFALATQNYTQGKSEHRGIGFKLSGADSNFFGDILSHNAFGHTGFTGTSLAIEPESGLYITMLTNRVHPTRSNTAIIRFRRLLHNCIATEFHQASEE